MQLQKKDDKIQTFDNETAIKNIISRQEIEENVFKLKSIHNSQLSKISSDMDEIHEVSNIFGRRSSAFSRINLTLNHITPYQNLKQCISEIENRRLALKENFFKIKENLIKIKILRLEIDQQQTTYMDFDNSSDVEKIAAKNELKELEIDRLQSSIIDIRLYVEGALKEIAIFQQAYNEIKESFNIKTWDEKDFEEAEAEYQIKRCLQQCIRNIIECGRIRSDNQEWLENLGINPFHIQQQLLQLPLFQQRQKSEISYSNILDIINNLYEDYKDYYKIRLEQKGIKNTYNRQIIYKNV